MRASVFRDILDSVVLQIRIELHEFLITGCFHSGLHYLSCHSCGGVLNLNAQLAVRSSNGDTEMTTVHRVLLDKHPLSRLPHPSTLLDSTPDPVNPIIFDGLNGDAIHSASLQTAGAAGPSGLDATAWCRLCCSFKSASVALCSALAAVGHHLPYSRKVWRGESLANLANHP